MRRAGQILSRQYCHDSTVTTGWFQKNGTARILGMKRSLYLNLTAALAISVFGSACAKKKIAAVTPVKSAPVAEAAPAPAPARVATPEPARPAQQVAQTPT